MIYLTLHKHHPKITGKSPYGTPRKEQPYGLILSPPRRVYIGRCGGFRFFGLRFFSRPESGRDKKDAESSKIVTSPYKRTAETVFGGRKSENIISSFEGIREDSDSIPQIRLY